MQLRGSHGCVGRGAELEKKAQNSVKTHNKAGKK